MILSRSLELTRSLSTIFTFYWVHCPYHIFIGPIANKGMPVKVGFNAQFVFFTRASPTTSGGPSNLHSTTILSNGHFLFETIFLNSKIKHVHTRWFPRIQWTNKYAFSFSFKHSSKINRVAGLKRKRKRKRKEEKKRK
jgi:hypothetical protein